MSTRVSTRQLLGQHQRATESGDSEALDAVCGWLDQYLATASGGEVEQFWLSVVGCFERGPGLAASR